ncbi:c-type cytochrome [Thermomonas sp. HDW16]|uniref:c-type cytochrome n=1 Tax=Thermomonas sp. HDW16 TaxID=2714945 RepID=UPI00140BA8D6|nr:c-type cytochrome [Thermomonas sp. HDW16]QIL20750.1 cytochrome c4 [Thermomonas sp. HDW16]
MKRLRSGVFTATAFALAAGVLAGVALAQDPTPATAATDAPTDASAAPTAAPAFRDLRRIRPIQGDAAAGLAKSELCAACHGANGVAIAPIFPNLAGQHADYLYWELMEYHSGAMPDSPMAPLAASLSEADMRDLALYYASLPTGRIPAEEGAAPPDPALMARGKQLFTEGDPSKGIPPCQGCHGADAKGFPNANQPDRDGDTPWAVYPMLRGQNAAYLQSRLATFHGQQLHSSTADHVMNGVGQRLDDNDIAAVSTWLSELAP